METGRRRRPCVLMVCDFFWPSLGGVENHMWSLAQNLMLHEGHKVVVLTHGWGERTGVRVMTNGLKVYYAPWLPAFQNCSMPTFFPLLPLLREIALRERVDVVHGHQDSSALMHEALFHAQTLGLKTCFTSHSLFNIFDPASLHLNKVLRFTLSSVDHCIAVSNTCKENMVVRAKLRPETVSTIPNAVDASTFRPKQRDESAWRNDESAGEGEGRGRGRGRGTGGKKSRIGGAGESGPSDVGEDSGDGCVTIVVISRLAYRKGTDLVAQVIPLVCARFPQVRFVIGGDGEKRLLLDEMRERHQLHDRVELLGSVPYADVRAVLCRGTIFLNCSLTESFCMAILEAACCGLYVISTKVGGIPEVLPADMIAFAAEPTAAALAACVANAIEGRRLEEIDAEEQHERVKRMYDWKDVARRVAGVYERILDADGAAEVRGEFGAGKLSFEARMRRCMRVGPLAGLLSMLLVVVDTALLAVARFMRPDHLIEVAPDFDVGAFPK